jgi:prepilin-type N-terminal cleavage/methylation domain-containing protein
MLPSTDADGFSLVEVMVALAVLCVGFMAIAGVTAGTLRGRSFSAAVTCAAVLAQDKMEALTSASYYGLPSADSTEMEDYGEIAGYPVYKRVVSVDAVEPTMGMKTVAVTVFWDSDRHAVCLKTIIAK